MRNIAILEWGPASLYYLEPRELINVRTNLLPGGPVMPPFLYAKEEAKRGGTSVRYVLAASEDLNKVIKNVRQCFGFPYPDAIGYYNAVNTHHRSRREHEGLIDRLRTWAIVGNVDAIVWIDFEKPQRDKVGPRRSVPFSDRHLRLVGETHVSGGAQESSDDGDREDDEYGLNSDDVAHRSRDGFMRVLNTCVAHREQQRALLHASLALPARGLAFPGETKREVVADPVRVEERFEEELVETVKQPEQIKPRGWKEEVLTLQPEFVPVPGSIYTRSTTPGPGHYPLQETWGKDPRGVRFTRKPRTQLEEFVRTKAGEPAPGQYEVKPSMFDSSVLQDAKKCHGVKFSDVTRLKLPVEGPNCAPVISLEHCRSSNIGIYSPGYYHDVPTGQEEMKRVSRFRSAPAHVIGTAKRM
jgi:hypothetical protein